MDSQGGHGPVVATVQCYFGYISKIYVSTLSKFFIRSKKSYLE